MVTHSLSSYDGGKVLFGFGGLGGIMHAGWMVKMWGSKGTTNCGDNAKITGYVTMVVGTMANLNTAAGGTAGATQCTLTASARVQWALSSIQVSNPLTESKHNNAASTVWLWGIEESLCGGNVNATTCATSTNAEPNYYAFGGSTGSVVDSNIYDGYGFGAYRPNIGYATVDGLIGFSATAPTGTNVFSDIVNTNHLIVIGASNEAFHKLSASVTLGTAQSKIEGYPGGSCTHSCWTAA